ncbi:MAG: tetratricopeptide repeat protein [Candidatus Aminicenantes bacterium]|nr:tetratricopeptide repeat protein [Candidatus Aminicenantes bacterium]
MKKKERVNTQTPLLFHNSGNQENFSLFYTFLSRPGKGLCLCQAMPPEQLKILEFFKTDPMGDRVHFIDMISPLSGPMELQVSVLDAIEKFGSSRDIFFIYHMEECIFQSKIDAKDFFNGLNLIRDFFGRFRAVFVFFMTESLVKTMIRHAFDFYDWMKLTFEFHPEKEQLLPQVMDTDVPWRKKYSDIDKKIKYLEKSLELMKNEKEQLLRMLELGSLYTQVYKYDKALEYFHAAEEIASRLGDKGGLSKGLSGEGSIFRIRGDYVVALEKYEQSLKIREEIGDKAGIAKSLHNIGIIFQKKGDYGTALKKYESARQVFEEMGDKANVAKSLHQMGTIYYFKGEYAAALEKYEQSLKIAEELGDRTGVAITLHQEGMICQMKGEYAAALEKYEQLLKIEEELGDRAGVAISLHKIGAIYHYKGDYGAALEKYETALKISEESGDRLGIALVYGQLGLLFQATGKFAEAFEYLLTALAIFTELESPDAAKTVGNLKQLRKDWGEEAFDEAMEKRRKRGSEEERKRIEEKKRESTVGANPRVRPFIDKGLWPYQ